jgi:hypothetical protein
MDHPVTLRRIPAYAQAAERSRDMSGGDPPLNVPDESTA